jgi:predicted TIM-barrel enzyme
MAESLGQLVPFAEGLIVGSSLKREGLAKNSVDIDRVRSLVAAVHRQSD